MRWRFLTVTVICYGLTILVQRVLRPAIDAPSWVALLLGVAPSFLYGAGFVLAAAAFRRLAPGYAYWGAAGTLAYELLQPFVAGRTFDPWDLVAGALGCGLALAVVERHRRQSPSTAAVAATVRAA